MGVSVQQSCIDKTLTKGKDDNFHVRIIYLFLKHFKDSTMVASQNVSMYIKVGMTHERQSHKMNKGNIDFCNEENDIPS